MNYKEIQELIRLINRSNITEFKFKEGEFSLTIKAGGNQPVIVQQTAVPAQVVTTPVYQEPTKQVSVAATPPKVEDNVPAATETAPLATANLLEIKSPIVGTFYRASSPEKPAFAKIGDTIKQGQVVCIIEAMKLFNEIESEISGKVVKVLVEDASPVEYDQVLFLVDPKG